MSKKNNDVFLNVWTLTSEEVNTLRIILDHARDRCDDAAVGVLARTISLARIDALIEKLDDVTGE